MARLTLLVLTVMLGALVIVDGRYYGRRMRRGFNNSGNGFGGYGRKGSVGGYGHDSDDDASVSQENNSGGCNLGFDRSGSREMAYNRDGRGQSGQSGQGGQGGQSREHARGGRSFTKSTATASSSASASALSQSQNKKKT